MGLGFVIIVQQWRLAYLSERSFDLIEIPLGNVGEPWRHDDASSLLVHTVHLGDGRRQ